MVRGSVVRGPITGCTTPLLSNTHGCPLPKPGHVHAKGHTLTSGQHQLHFPAAADSALWPRYEHDGGELQPARWRGGADPSALLRAVEWLLGLYSEHQKRLARDSHLERLQWEHTTFLGCRSDLELLVAVERSGSTNLDVLIPIELSERAVDAAQVPLPSFPSFLSNTVLVFALGCLCR